MAAWTVMATSHHFWWARVWVKIGSQYLWPWLIVTCYYTTLYHGALMAGQNPQLVYHFLWQGIVLIFIQFNFLFIWGLFADWSAVIKAIQMETSALFVFELELQKEWLIVFSGLNAKGIYPLGPADWLQGRTTASSLLEKQLGVFKWNYLLILTDVELIFYRLSMARTRGSPLPALWRWLKTLSS